MEERIRISLLLDFYGELLTEKQKSIMELYFNEDLSLAEISELTSTSRQAIFDIIKRCEKSLLDYENKLNLLAKSIKLQKTKETIINKLSEINNIADNSNIELLVNDIQNEIMDNI